MTNVKLASGTLGNSVNMTKEVACSQCGFRVRADSDDELVEHFQQHNKAAHHMETSREQILAKAKTVQVATA
jgi:predicted small metal-binding protein